MTVVSGNYSGRLLKTLGGKTSQPTSDKVRGAIFNMIGPYFEGGRVLNLFVGSGNEKAGFSQLFYVGQYLVFINLPLIYKNQPLTEKAL